ncbi:MULTISPECIES: hypothetical protein [Halanaerobium]|jgi:hypothetical protein|uniref:Uncharacterized protein n=1 Tax=Halanaerobium kushneri TaxID=56779 RepID=A0A1N6UU37_9FIRM|nr:MULTISPECIES: hypothetical protein [Halanaerobium]RCW50592.1 hypothetical protein DFR80_1474 [Halanaerobium sp. ST460_2HS_T2]SIQ69099.1 hypothetical protein SAMN05421834_10727 [Halanaerobium kushneri]
MNKNEKSKMEMFYYYLKIGLAIAFVIWVTISINGLQGTAQENSNLILRPEFETSFLPGGPERFSEAYADVENVDTEAKVEEGDYLWSTILIANRGKKDGQELNINIETAAEMDQILVSPTGYSNEVNIETEDNKMSTEISVEELDIDDAARIFIGFNKDKINVNEQNWADSYEDYLKRISIESGNVEDIFYGLAY